MRKFKLSFTFLLIAGLLLTSCEKEATDKNFEQQVTEQSEVIPEMLENLEQEKQAPALGEKQLETSGIKSYVDRPKTEVLRPKKEEEATSRSSIWLADGNPVYSTTYGESNNYDGNLYMKGCLDRYYAFNAPDKRYLLYVPELMDVSFDLSYLTADLDLFIFTANWFYGPQDCIAYSVNPYQNAETMTLRMNPGVYVVLIDGYKYDQQSNFKLTVTFDNGCDDFDSYALGDISPQSADWVKWVPGAAFDGQVTDYRFFSHDQSLCIDHKPGFGNSDQMDVVKKIGEYTSGRYMIRWKMYVPHNRNAAFNFQKYNFPGLETGLVVYMRKGKGIAVRANGNIYHSSKTYTQNTWIDIFVDYDISGGMAVLSIDDQMIAVWDTSIRNNTPVHGTNRLGGIDFWAYHNHTTFHVDDLCVEDLSGIIIDYFFDPDAIYLDVL